MEMRQGLLCKLAWEQALIHINLWSLSLPLWLIAARFDYARQRLPIVAQTVLGSARAVQVEAAARTDDGAGRTPTDLVDAVCSPGGTTVAGLVAMERADFSSAVIEAVRAVIAADRESAAGNCRRPD